MPLPKEWPARQSAVGILPADQNKYSEELLKPTRWCEAMFDWNIITHPNFTAL
jgi:hypothetical protein